ncbi:putative PD-(D/E)XK nuclease-like domain-containing protein [Seiridium cardinale]|uniref:PD-(D/E)XK nuclease-like domain-containing protein n=1 Tax=Seiridium cardinale TaxID=138064 RepID=A0ABR2XII3_9PEZI
MANPTAAAIQDWLKDVQPIRQPRSQRHKRSRSHSPYPSPPQSFSSTSVMALTTPAKRRRPTTDADLRDDGQTPKAAPSSQRTNSDLFSETSSQTSSSYEDGFVLGKLQAPTQPLPATLISLVRDAESLSQGVGVVPAHYKDELVSGQAEDGTSYGSYFHDHIFATAVKGTAVSAAAVVTLSPAKVKRIVDRANLCEVRLEEEASWNMEVHHHILRAVCRPQGRRRLIDFMPCTTAKISRGYRPSRAPPKMVDFCLFVDPSRAADAVVAAAATKALD